MDAKMKNNLFEKGKKAYADGDNRALPVQLSDALAKLGHDDFMVGGKEWMRGWDTACAKMLMEFQN